MRGRVAAVGLLLAAVGLAGCGQGKPQIQETLQSTTTAAPAPGDLGSVTVSPMSGPPYTPITVSGANCTGPAPGVMISSEIGPLTPLQYRTSPDPAGNWSITILAPVIEFFAPPPVAPTVSPPRPIRLDVGCVRDGRTDVSNYESATFVVTAGEQGTFDMQPRVVPLGVTTTVTLSGTACHAPADNVGVTIIGVTDRGSDSTGSDPIVPDATGAWTVEIPVTPPRVGAAPVHVACLQGNQIVFGYLFPRLGFRELSFTG
jgi:hypothetical protein